MAKRYPLKHVATRDPFTVGPLTGKQAQYAEQFCKGLAKPHKYYHKLPQVQDAILNIQKKSQALTAYDITKEVAECDKAMDFAYERKHQLGVCKALELKLKLNGMLVDRTEVTQVGLKEALELAKSRAQGRLVVLNGGRDGAADGSGRV